MHSTENHRVNTEADPCSRCPRRYRADDVLSISSHPVVSCNYREGDRWRSYLIAVSS